MNRSSTITQGLDYAKGTGIGGYRINGYLRISTNTALVKQSITLFGVCILGMVVNNLIESAFSQGNPWLGGGYGPANNGHCVPAIAYDDSYVECVTWGRVQRMDWSFFSAYINDAYMPYGPEMTAANGKTFSGYDPNRMGGLANEIVLSYIAV